MKTKTSAEGVVRWKIRTYDKNWQCFNSLKYGGKSHKEVNEIEVIGRK